MNKAESKYFNTAIKMDEAFLFLLAQKDFEYITVKEICKQAQVHRSTFYLHYETLNDLLEESVAYMNQQFLDYCVQDSEAFIKRIEDCPQEELYLLTPKYLLPYLHFIKENKRLFQTALKQSSTLSLRSVYNRLFVNVFTPILKRFNIPEKERAYAITFYIHGLIAMVNEWLKKDCQESIEEMIHMIQKYTMRR